MQQLKHLTALNNVNCYSLPLLAEFVVALRNRYLSDTVTALFTWIQRPVWAYSL